MPACKGNNLLIPENVDFNYHLVQPRVQIEHAIGILKGQFSGICEMRSQIRNESTMIGTANFRNAFQKNSNQLQISSGVYRGGGQGVEEEAGWIDKVPTELSNTSAPAKQAPSTNPKKPCYPLPPQYKRVHFKKPKKAPGPPPPPKCHHHSHLNPPIPTFVSEAEMMECIVCDVYW